MHELRRPKTLSEYQQMSNHIYGKKNRNFYTDDELIRRLMEEACAAMELARKDRRGAFRLQLPRIFMWTLAAANRLDINLQEAMWYKFPGVCSYCLRDKSCLCGSEHPEIPDREESLRRLRRDRKEEEPITLEEHQSFHRLLYGWQNDRILLIQTVAHIAEEAGEISTAHRHKDKQALREELSDIVSWTLSTATRLDYNLHDIVWGVFPYECELCKQNICKCPTVP